jgi:hypothetical protein
MSDAPPVGHLMQTRLRMRTWIALVIIVALAVPAVMNARSEWQGAESQAQHAATIVEVSYGLIGLLGTIAVIMRAPWARQAILAWAVLITLTAGLAPRVWGGSSLLMSLVSAVFGALIATVITMLVLPSRWNPS